MSQLNPGENDRFTPPTCAGIVGGRHSEVILYRLRKYENPIAKPEWACYKLDVPEDWVRVIKLVCQPFLLVRRTGRERGVGRETARRFVRAKNR
jgi:hypothetical protein